MLKITNVHKSFKKNKILNGVDLTVNKGDVVVILGPSGSGKTTLLRTIAFLETADKGELEFDEIKTSLSNAHKKTILDENRVKATLENYRRIKNDVAETAIKAGRSADDVRLMCVTKTVAPEYINPVLDDGADLIGENRVQEYCSKLDTLSYGCRRPGRVERHE